MKDGTLNKSITVIETQAVEISDLEEQVTGLELEARAVTIENEAQCLEAAKFGRELRGKINEVVEMFAPMKKSAHDAHKQICNKEKQILTPLRNAEKALGRAIGLYYLEQETARKSAEIEARKIALEETDKLLELSIEAEKKGDFETAQNILLDAEITDETAQALTIPTEKTKVDGVSTRKNWEITAIEADKVPIEVNGVTIRPIDEKAVLKLIRESKGEIEIDGIEYRETLKAIFRK